MYATHREESPIYWFVENVMVLVVLCYCCGSDDSDDGGCRSK